MNVKINSIKFDADSKLLDVIQKKTNKLSTFFDKIIDAEIFLKLNNEGIKNKTVEIKLNIPGNQLFATANASSFEAACDEVTQALTKQIKKFKKKLMNH